MQQYEKGDVSRNPYEHLSPVEKNREFQRFYEPTVLYLHPSLYENMHDPNIHGFTIAQFFLSLRRLESEKFERLYGNYCSLFSQAVHATQGFREYAKYDWRERFATGIPRNITN